MRHARNVGNNRLARYVFADGKCQFAAKPRKFNCTDNFPDVNLALEFVRNLNTDCRFARIGSILTPVAARFRAISSTRLVILLIFNAGFGLELIPGYGGPFAVIDNFASTPKEFRVSISFLAVRSKASSIIGEGFSGSLKRLSGGNS
jgi:hypothetical protein